MQNMYQYIASVSLPLKIDYLLYLPGGGFIPYQTVSDVSVEDVSLQKVTAGPTAAELLAQQISDRVIRYHIEASNITFVQVG